MRRFAATLLLLLCCGTASATANINILFIYTPSVLAYFGSPAAVDSAVNTALSGLNPTGGFNAALASSGVALTVSKAGIGSTPTEWSVNDWYSPAHDIMIQLARDQSKADVVVILTRPLSSGQVTCGYAGGVRGQLPTPQQAFAMVNAYCMGVMLTVQHEVGHLLGLHHQATGGINPDGILTPYAQGHGLVSTTSKTLANGVTYFSCFYTIMANQFFSCPSVPGYVPDYLNYYSNPNIMTTDTTGGHLIFPVGNSASPYYASEFSVLPISGPIVANFHNTSISTGIAAVLNAIMAGILIGFD